MVQKVIATYLQSYLGQWSKEEIRNAAGKILLGALTYGFLNYDSGKIIRFVIADWIQMEGNTGPYLQYTDAGCRSLLNKVEAGLAAAARRFTTDLEQARGLPP